MTGKTIEDSEQIAIHIDGSVGSYIELHKEADEDYPAGIPGGPVIEMGIDTAFSDSNDEDKAASVFGTDRYIRYIGNGTSYPMSTDKTPGTYLVREMDTSNTGSHNIRDIAYDSDGKMTASMSVGNDFSASGEIVESSASLNVRNAKIRKSLSLNVVTEFDGGDTPDDPALEIMAQIETFDSDGNEISNEPFMATEPSHVATKAYVDSSGGITIQDVKDLLSDDYKLTTIVEDSEKFVNFGDEGGLDSFNIDITFDNSDKPGNVSSKTSGGWTSNKIDLHVSDSEAREEGESYGYMQIEDDPSSSERFVATLGSWNRFNDKRSFIKAYQTERRADSVATLEIQGDDVSVEDTNGDPFMATEPSHVAAKAYVDQQDRDLRSYLRALSDITGARINKIVKVTDTGDSESGNKIYEIELEYYNGSTVPVSSIGNNYTIGYTNTDDGYVPNRDLYIQDNKFRVVARSSEMPAVNSWARIDKPVELPLP